MIQPLIMQSEEYNLSSKSFKSFKSQIILDSASLVNNNGKYVIYSQKAYDETFDNIKFNISLSSSIHFISTSVIS